MERKTRVIRYIANFECNTNHSIGLVWQTAGMISRHQFRDGFIYGIENPEKKMTGKIFLLTTKINSSLILCRFAFNIQKYSICVSHRKEYSVCIS